MKKSRNIGIILSPIGVLLGLSLLWIFVAKPQINQFVLKKIQQINQDQDFVQISLKNFDVSLLKLQVQAQDLEVQIKKPAGLGEPLTVKRIIGQFDPFRLLVGQVGLSQIQITGFNWVYKNETESKSDFKKIPTEVLFQWLPRIPIDVVVIQNSQFTYSDKPLNMDLFVQASFLSLRNLKSALGLEARRVYTTMIKDQKSEIRSELSLTTRLNYNSKGSTLQLDQIELKNINSYLQAKGKIENFEDLPTTQKGQISLKTQIQLDDVRTMALAFQPSKTRWPTLTGSVHSEGQLTFNGLNNIDGQLNLETQSVGVDHFKFGQAKVSAAIRKNQISINQIQVEHPSGTAQFKQIEVQQNEPYAFKTTLQLENFDLQKLFHSIGLKDIPAGLKANGQAVCSGSLKPEFTATCEAQTNVRDIWVKANLQENHHIVKLKEGRLDGRIDFTDAGLEYKTKIFIGSSEGVSQGQVSFEDGFKIQFETARLNFNDVESLADLNFKGDLKIKGQTTGGSEWGTIQSVVTFTNAEIDSFRLDQISGQLTYDKSVLKLTDIVGKLGQSAYKGQLAINFKDTTLQSQIDAPDLHGEDLFFALSKRFTLPFELTGRGHAKVQLSGPLDFWKLKYDLDAELKRGTIAGEGFENLDFDLKATGDAIQFNNVSLKKNRGRLTLTGLIDTQTKEPLFKVNLKATPLYLEEMDHLIKLAPALTGQAWVDGKVTGPLAAPELQFNFSAKQVNLDNKDYPSSQGQVNIDIHQFKFNGQFFGRQIQSDLVWPWKESNPYSLRLQIRDLDPLMFLPFISIPQPSAEYYGRLNADVDLKASRRELKQTEGTIRVNDFMLQRGVQYLKLRRPSTLTYKSGLRQMDPIELRGEGNSLSVSLDSSTNDETKLRVASDLQLRLFQFLVSFSQSFGGRLKADTSVKIRSDSFDLFGDGELTDGIVAFKGFPQAIDNINAPIQFSKSKIILSDIFAQLGQSEILGQGQVDIRGPKNIVVNLQASTDNLELNFPDKVMTTGRADLAFHGNWLPYTLKVDYRVARGLVEKNFDEADPNAKVTLKSSPFLPQKQTEETAASLLLDADIDLNQGVIVKNKLLEGEAFGRLKIGGSPEQPEIIGQIDIRSGSKLIFKDKYFDIQTATIKFNDPQAINPDIYINASARVSEYDISLLIQGPAKNLSIQPVSTPPLSKEDIFSLLALGMTSSKMDQSISSEAQQQQTGLEVIAQGVNSSQINKQIQQKFGLTVQLAPTIDSTKNIAVPKVVVSKSFTKNVNASYSRPITGDNPVQEWKLQYLFNPNSSMNLNYQSTESTQQQQNTINTNKNDAGILGLDFEYKKEWK